MRGLRVRRAGKRWVVSLMCAGAMMFGSVLPLLSQDSGYDAVKPKVDLAASAVTSLGDLAGRFLDVQSSYQMITPPSSGFILQQDGGVLVFDPKNFPESFSSALIGTKEYDCPVYAVTGIEDPESRAVQFFNAEGRKIASVTVTGEYDPWWLLNLYFPDLQAGRYSEQKIKELKAEYDPSRVRIIWKILPVEYAGKYAQALADAQAEEAAAVLKSGLGGNVSPMMMYQGASVTNLMLYGIETVTNGMRLSLVYPDDFTNRVDFFTCDDLVPFWWNLAVSATNVNTSTNWIEWTDTMSLSQPVRFYAAGNADLNSDSDGIPDAREMFLYHTSPTNSDTDSDGLADNYEIETLDTDPTNPKTNKPNIRITYPANESRKVWLP